MRYRSFVRPRMHARVTKSRAADCRALTPPITILGNQRLFRIFVLAPFAGHHHIDGTAPAPGTDQPLMPIENRRLGTVPPRHFGRIGLSLISAFEAPDKAAWLPARP